MTATASAVNPSQPLVHECAREAGQRIAPTWPLDQMIAVNPWWEMRDESIEEVAARVALLGHAHGHMPRDWFKAQYPQLITRDHISRAARDKPSALDTDALVAWLDGKEELPQWRNFSDQADAGRDLERKVSWHDEIIHQISQFCASFYSEGTPLPSRPDRCLYEAWLESVRHDRGIEIMMGERGLHRHFDGLPNDAETLLEQAIAEFGIEEAALGDYFHALLLDVNGWASWVAYLRWQANLAGSEDDALPELLAVRLAWELVLWRHLAGDDAEKVAQLRGVWQQQFAALPDLLSRHLERQRPAWTWQRAAELAFQDALHAKLFLPQPQADATTRPRLQAALCIDVRSEVFRRHLEAQDDAIQTLGFAGFFGLPIAYSPAGGSYQRPQLPGLLSPAITVSEVDEAGSEEQRARQLNRDARWSAVGRAAPGSFGYVESVGLGYAVNLLRESLLGKAAHHPVNELCSKGSQFELRGGDGVLDKSAQAQLAAGILGAMTLTANFAPVVILAGHGSSTRNNPHAAGLDCGACGGQTGEVNVRVLAQVLNDEAVRAALAADHDLHIPSDTRFVPAIHDTTTDDMRLLAELPKAASEVQQWLNEAGESARQERAANLGIEKSGARKGILQRSRDWSQVRPEWGLAGNACFIVAPRSRSRHLDLGGRSFLHDYDAAADAENGYPVLELIMTAPMVVTHWINMQYNASVIDNERYGSGNKVLHNVVGGNLGVFEGNGGDLRIGLPLQSVHNGERWMHETLRLSVYIDAPASAIATIAEQHEVVRQLIDNEWLYLFRIDDERGEIQRLFAGEWSVAAAR